VLRHKSPKDSGGFTLVELLVSITLLGIFAATFSQAFDLSIFGFFDLQSNALEFSTLAESSERIADVIRGTTDFVSLGNNNVTLYAYFYPSDTYASLIHYYLNTQNNQLLADVTPMTANPPFGTPIASQMHTYTIINNYYDASGVNLFTYLDASGGVLTVPVSNEHLVTSVLINLAVPGSSTTANNNQSMQLTVFLRNRKTNL
jgi:prepilin-type N-terminal cleavage/methylation domain-containing protein